MNEINFTNFEFISFQVQKFAYNDETEKLEYRETQIMILPSHMACQCKCRVKAAVSPPTLNNQAGFNS